LSGLVQIFRIALYDEDIEFSLLFTYKHSSTHMPVVLNRSSSMFVWHVIN